MNISTFCIFLFRQLQDAGEKSRISFLQTPQEAQFFSTFPELSARRLQVVFFFLQKSRSGPRDEKCYNNI